MAMFFLGLAHPSLFLGRSGLTLLTHASGKALPARIGYCRAIRHYQNLDSAARGRSGESLATFAVQHD